MAWVFRNARDSFKANQKLWNEINALSGNHILLDSALVEILLRHYGTRGTLFGVSNDERAAGVVLVEPEGPGFWKTFQPSQAPLGLIILKSKEDVPVQVHRLMRDLPGFALGFAVLQQDPDWTHFGSAEDRRLERIKYITTSRLTLSGTFQEYWKSRSHNLIHNLSRQRRRFTEQGQMLELISEHRAERVADEVREYGQLERSGWKAKQGTAVTANNVQGRFYREIMEHFCDRGEGIIYRLVMGQKSIASALCLMRGDTMIMLKIGYDEGLSKCSPGLLLQEEILKSVFTAGQIRIIEYYGRYTDWHRKWTTDIRQMYHINCYRHPWIATGRRVLKTGGGALHHTIKEKIFRSKLEV